MPFVNEYIPEADKDRIDFSKFKHPVLGDPLSPYKWTIDRERDVALIPVGTGGEPITRPSGIEEQLYLFVMYWRGQVLSVFVSASHTGNSRTNDLEVTWSINRCDVPESVPREEMRKTLKEALFAYGYMSSDIRDKVKAVHCMF